jgi:hypothetical protein
MIRLISSMVVLLTFCAKITCAGEPTRIDALLRGTGWNQVADGLFENRNITLGQLRKEIGEKFQFQLIHAGFSGEALWEVPQGSFIITPLEFDGLRVSDNTHVVANYFSSNLKNNQQLESFKILEKELIAKGYVKDLTHPDNLLSLSGSLAQLEKDMGFVLLLSQDSKYFFGRKGAICAGFWPINPQEEKKLNGRLYITWGPPAAPNRISFDKQKLVDAGFSLTRGILTHNRTANDIINDLEIEMDRIQKLAI